MDELIAWLRQQLDEDERVARAATEGASGRWRRITNGTGGGVSYDDGPDDWPVWSTNGVVVYDEGFPTKPQAEHIARWDPARVLREVEAKRLILSEHAGVDVCDAHDANLETVPCPTLLALALSYSDRLGYREEAWKP